MQVALLSLLLALIPTCTYHASMSWANFWGVHFQLRVLTERQRLRQRAKIVNFAIPYMFGERWK